MTNISAKIIADSISPESIRLTTLHLRYPRFIHAEFMTHRVFSRNARSSRAVPVETMIREIETDPVVPLFWGKNQKGMQAAEECAEMVPFRYDEVPRDAAWLRARDNAVTVAKAFMKAGYHKQVVNRLLEPFMHIDVLVTATAWDNFFALRDHRDAEPHIAVLAREMKAAFAESRPRNLAPGEWHLPYVDAATREEVVKGAVNADHFRRTLIAVSVARCARISYRPFDGNGSIEAEIARHDALVGAQPMHASPAEHQATPDEYSHTVFGEAGVEFVWENSHEHGNLGGWRQYRKTLPGEDASSALPQVVSPSV
ncbi:FAD-dependent thymidylate synthase [Methylobacterium aquaticum]|uniref:Predicted alternative thymidylate synthase n=1 Tax=Methylobacterium aquaticum TaxID=270351 RepID=A0A0C6G2K1_9HYPH|nr:FAD-dependent thymidylate synthase [Methylobacterium aquaticum]BAQ50365.1 predicted alternative thymidylate synthase [Methylobacterium aquaticum]